MRILEVAAIDMTIYKFVLPLMKELQKDGFEVSCAASYMGASEKIESEGFRVYNPLIKRRIDPIANGKSVLELYKIIRDEKIDIIHVHTPIASVVGRIAAKLAGVKKVVYTVHGFYMNNKILYHVERFMAKYFTDYMITVNEEDRVFAIEERFMDSDRIININSVGVDTRYFNPQYVDMYKVEKIKTEFSIKQSDKIIGFVGRIVTEKGILDLLDAFVKLKDKYSETKLLIIGSSDLGERDNETLKKVEEIIDRNQLQERVIFAGHRDDIRELLSIMDIFVLPSYREGMPVALLEAMAMETCAVATDIRGCREEVDEKTGRLYMPGNSEELGVELGRLLENKELRDELGKNARKKVKLLFEQRQVLEKQMKLFRSLI